MLLIGIPVSKKRLTNAYYFCYYRIVIRSENFLLLLFSHFGLFLVPANFTNTFQAPSIKLFEPAQRRQNLNANKKILRKSNGNSGVKMRMNPVTKRPASMYVSSDLNGNHQPQISSKSRSLLPNQTLRNMTVLEKVKTPFLCQFLPAENMNQLFGMFKLNCIKEKNYQPRLSSW